jgi:exopolysaccharide biosynthesis polyprenyl glycosylphosphotransferase
VPPRRRDLAARNSLSFLAYKQRRRDRRIGLGNDEILKIGAAEGVREADDVIAFEDVPSDQAPRVVARISSFLRPEAPGEAVWRHGRRRGWLVRRMLVVADLAGLSFAYATVAVVFRVDWKFFVGMVATFPLWILIARIYRLYDQDEERTHHTAADDVVGVFHLVTIGTWVTYVGVRVVNVADPTLAKAAVLWAAAIIGITVARSMARAVCRRSPLYVQNTLILGAGDVGQRVARKLRRHPEYGLNLVGFVDANPKARYEDLADLPVLGGPDELADLVLRHGIERVVVAFSNESAGETLAAVRALNDFEIQIDVVPRLFELVSPSVKIDTLEGLPLIELPPARLPRSAQMLKRTVDLVGSAVLLVLTAPFVSVIALAIKLDSHGPVFFRQTRLGRGEREFTVLKFRTMHVGSDIETHRAYIGKIMSADVPANGNGLYKLERPDAITRVGRLLRKTSLDEVPQLLNVFRGEMSLVGPRPCIPYETELFEPHHFDRFLVPAGITGLWQVTARAHSTFAEALEMDVAYARGWSLGLDLRLLCRTPLAVISGKGAV